ncbi:MAG: AMP-binding protein, partial [Caulobacteraceae bacterium]
MPSPVNGYQRALLGHFAKRPDAVFCRQVGEQGETTLLWRDLEADCGRFAAAYRAALVRPDDQVLIFLRHVPQLYGAFFGAMLTGAVPAFMPCSSPRQDAGLYWRSHQILLGAIRPAAIVTDAPTLAEMRVAGLAFGEARVILIEETVAAALTPVLVPETATALLQHSSGTTGLKKGVALGYAAILAQIESYARAIDLSADDTIVSWLPLYHDMGLIACLILPAYFGAP